MAKDGNLDRPPGNLPPMSAAHPELHRAQKRRRQPREPSRSPSRSRHRPVQPKSKSKPNYKKRKSTHLVNNERDEDEDRWFTIRNIIDEKFERGKIHYLLDWEGTDKNGKPYPPSWQPEQNVTSVAIKAWRDSRTRAKGTRNAINTVVTSSGSGSSPMKRFNIQESDITHSPKRSRRSLVQKSSSEQPHAETSAFGKEAIRERRRAKSLAATSESTDRGPKSSEDPLELPGERDKDNFGNRHISDSNIQEIQGLRRPQIAVELPQIPLFDTNEYIPVSLPTSSQQTNSQLSSQHTHFNASQVHQSELRSEDNRTIPDSQEISGFSTSETQDSIIGPRTSFTASQVHGEVTAKSQQQLKFQPLDQSTEEIPSHQPDHRIVNSRESYSGSVFVIETNSNSTQSNHSQSTTIGSRPIFLTQENYNIDIVPPTSQPNNSTPAPAREPPSDEPISGTNIISDLTFTKSSSIHSQPSNFQAAQIVVPLSSQQGALATNSEANLTVYDDDSIIPDSVSRDPHNTQSNTQESSQALSELDGNTRSNSSSKGYQLASQLMLDHIQLSQAGLDKSANNIEAEESSISHVAHTPAISNHSINSDSSSTPRRQALPTNMDGVQPTQLSARETLRLIRERNFASLNEPFPGPTGSTDANLVNPKVDAPAVSQADVSESHAIEQPPIPDVSPITPPRLSSPILPAQPLGAATQSEPSIIPETTQMPVEHGTQSGLELESAPAEVGINASEEQPTTLDPAALTLSIENDMDVIPSLHTHDVLQHNLQTPDEFSPHDPHEEDDIAPSSYPKSLLPYVPTGTNEYLITLPYYSSSRPMYNDILRENEDLIHEYTASFRVLPHLNPHPTTVAKLDEMFSRLFDICDLPPFMETIPSMTLAEVTKHVIGTNAKFAFVAELLTLLAEVNSDKKVLILVRPGQVMDLLDRVIQTKRYHYIQSGQEVISPSAAQHLLTVIVSSTLDNSATIPGDVDVVVAFDHTYRPELLPSPLRERSPLLLVLTNTCSIQHLNMRVSENLEPPERKNVLVLALVKAMRYVEDVGSSQINQLHKAAELFSDYIQDPEDEDFYWEPQEIPEDVFEDLHAASSQSQLSQPSLQGFIIDQAHGSRKRSHEADEDDEASSKRPRVLQPTIVTGVSHISDSLKELIGDDSISGSPNATISVSVGRLEALSAKITSLESKLEESKQREKQFRELSNRSKKEVDSHAATVNLVQAKFMTALKDRGTYEDEYYKAKEETRVTTASLESSRKEAGELKEKNAQLQEQLSAAKELLLKSTNPELVKMAELAKDLDDAQGKVQLLEKKIAVTKNDMEYAKSAYQDASQRAGELQAENRALEQQVEELKRKADSNIVEVNKIQAANESRELLRMLEEQRSIVRDRDLELGRVKDELKTLKESRRGTRQSSVPRSPRLSAFNSPRNGGARAKGGSSSRGTSPAPPPTGVFETGAGGGTPAPNNRASHLRESRF